VSIVFIPCALLFLIFKARTLYDYEGRSEDELSFQADHLITVDVWDDGSGWCVCVQSVCVCVFVNECMLRVCVCVCFVCVCVC
jgi:hypothetical protein